MPEGTLNRRLPFCRFHFLKDSFIFFINIQLALPSFKARKVLIFKWLIFSRQQIMVLHAIFFHDFQKISLISLLELLSFMNFQILKYNLTRSEGLYQFFALTGYIFSHIMLAWPFYDLPCSTFFRLSSASERILKMTTFSDKYQQQANHSKIFFGLNFFLIEAENRAECLKDWFSPFPDFPVLTYNCLVTGTIIHFPFEIDTLPVSIVISILLLQFIPSLRLFCPYFKSFNDFLCLC